MRGGQLGLLLWKNYVVRKRRPAIVGLVFLWPVAVFLLLYTVRDNVDPEYNPTCQFPPRLMPHDGLLPFVQSYICSIGNECEAHEGYKELPVYENSTLGPIMMELQLVLTNRTILEAVKTLPKSIQMLKSMAQILTKPEIKKIFEKGIRLGDLFNDHEAIKGILRVHLPKAEDAFIDGLLNASIKLYYLIETFGSSNLGGIICSPESLKKYLIPEKDEDLAELSNVLCNIESRDIPKILDHLTRHLDFSGLLEMVSRITAKFREYDFIDDLVRAIDTVLNLKSVRKYVPKEIQLREWLPKIVELFRNVTRKEIDRTLIDRAIAQLEPIFSYDRDWPIVRHGLVKLNSLIGIVDNLVMKKKSYESSTSTFELTKKLHHGVDNIPSRSRNYSDVTSMLDLVYVILNDAVKLTNRIIDRNEDRLTTATEILDGLRDFFPQNIMNVLTYVVSMIENIVRMTHHVAIIHEEIGQRLYDVCVKNMDVVKMILTTVQPEAYRTLLISMSRLNFTERLTDELRKKRPEVLICEEQVLSEMFHDYKDFGGNSSIIRELLCSENGKVFVAELYENFELNDFRKNIDDTLSTFISMALGQPVRIERSNLTSLVTRIKNLVLYLDKESSKRPDWSVFQTSEGWNQVFSETRIQGRITVLGVHLSIAKSAGSKSLSYVTIKPDLEHLDFIADMILLDLRKHPTSWIGKVREHESELVESFYMTVADRKKTLKILEYSNFSQSYCTAGSSSDLVNYPSRSNATLLKDLVCRLARSVQTNLHFNRTEFEAKEKIVKERGPFDWTAFNGKTLKIYEYIETLLPQIDEHYDEKSLKELEKKFVQSWTRDLTVRDAWEITIGSICKLLDVAESPLFDVRSRTSWDVLYPVGRAASLVADTVERVVDRLQSGDRASKLTDVLRDLPRTEILLDVLLRNSASLVHDAIDLLTLVDDSPLEYASLMKDYASDEIDWPCVKNRSVGAIVKLRDGSREIIREMERLVCDPGSFAREWKDHETFAGARRVFDGSVKDSSAIPVFNWTRGYVRFRSLIDKIESLVNTETTSLTDDRGEPLEVSLRLMRKTLADDLPNAKKSLPNFFESIDNAIERNVAALTSSRSAAIAFDTLNVKRGADDFLIIGKFATRAIRDVVQIFLRALDSNVPKLMNLLGFTEKSVIRLLCERGPYVAATVVNGLSDPSLDLRAYEDVRRRDGLVTCSDVFSWFNDYRRGLSTEDYLILKNATCDGDPEYFNAFTDLYLRLTTLWRRPVGQYRGYYATLATEVWRLADLIGSRSSDIETPFGNGYVDRFLILLKDGLIGQSTRNVTIGPNSGWRTYRLAVEAVSEILEHAADALNDSDPKVKVVHTWDLVPSGDVRQLLKFCESHAVEALALAATLTTFDFTSAVVGPDDGPRRLMCDDHFRSDYWRREDRIHFLSVVCGYDPRQLLRRATSDEFYEAVDGSSTVLRVESLARSLARFIDALRKLRSTSGEGKRLVSNVLNVTTWISMPEDSREIVRIAERSWARRMADRRGRGNSTDRFFALFRLEETLAFLLDVASGGDLWTKWKNANENPRSRAMFALMEDVPSLAVTFLDTFASSDRLNDFFVKFLEGDENGCAIEKYLAPSSFVGRKGCLTSIGTFCREFAREAVSYEDVAPIKFYSTELERNATIRNAPIFNETRVFERMMRIERNLLHLLVNGSQPVGAPSWWISFAEGTWIDFTERYSVREVKPLIRSIVGKIARIVEDATRTRSPRQQCSWCNVLVVQILNSQLSRHEIYSNLLCSANRLNYSSLREIAERDLYWNRTIDMIRGYEYLSKPNDLESFVNAIRDAVSYIADIIVDHELPTDGKNITECLRQALAVTEKSGIGFYAKILVGVVDSLRRNVRVFDTATSHEMLSNLTRMAESLVPIWRPLGEAVKTKDAARLEKILPNATINVNLLLGRIRNSSRARDLRDELSILLTSKKAKKLLLYDVKAAKYPTIRSVADLLAGSLDFEAIDAKIDEWRSEASRNFTWLREILSHVVVVIEEGGSLLNVASRIDFEDVSSLLGVPDIADGLMSLLNDRTIDKLFDGLKETMDDFVPFVADPELMEDMRAIVGTFENMDIFKNLGLLDLRYKISEMFVDWNDLRRFIVDEIGLDDDAASKLGRGRIDMLSIFLKERPLVSLEDIVCSPKNLKDVLDFESVVTSAEKTSDALCGLPDEAVRNITVELIKRLNFPYIFSNLMSANVKNILKNADLTEAEGREVFDSLGVAAELVPFFKDKLASGLASVGSSTDEPTGMKSSERFLRDAGESLCGKPLVNDGGRFYSVIGGIEDNRRTYDQVELDSLPTDFCRDAYKNVLSTNGGKIVWSYVKPLLRGRILYAPNTTLYARIMSFSNETFGQIENFGALANAFERTLRSLASLSEMGDSLKDLENIMVSKVMRMALESMSEGRFEADFANFDISDVAWRLGRSSRLIDTIAMINEFMECVLASRIEGFASEEELEVAARRLVGTNEFLAAVVFLDENEKERGFDDSTTWKLPRDVIYKIRMDVDYVPSTKRSKTQFWLPGPEASFVEDLRYLRGFVQLQDSIDRAIVREKSGRMGNWKTITRQMPYPCWKRTPFISTLYESQGVQVCFFFALMMCVGSAVRYIVWERESQNSMVMSVMGLKPWRNTLAWFVTTCVELTIVMLSICIILIAGKILPRADPVLVLFLLLDYVFSVVTFSYMISTMFSSASLAAVTTVVMFLLTYMPYVIVIAMEASMSLGWKILICLSMSTSFSYGCLYIVRREVQGTGITWEAIWDESMPGDSMSFGLVLVTIALDGVIYALIGYFIARYTNSGRDFRGLRSRSLWWAGTRSLYGRPSYLAFVNSLYYTNDVLHPSAIYQDEDSDSGSTIVSEKQAGVRFEAVRKVFPSAKGDHVAVDDFTVKLCEGEVTSLLGRNGAGKTTIIKMLTGMLAPTSGEIYLNGEEGTKPDIGVCPQDNVLIDTLTPREHMIFYASLKRPTDDEAMLKNVESMLASLELGGQEHEPVYRLSGGTKRRLCVALAFLGSPKLVILDEPGAGVDPAARRRIWRLIDQHRVNRTVLLSTHHLDEADMLSDTVVVMHRGKILCTGSPLSLKTNYGRGYRLNVEFPAAHYPETSIDPKDLENLRSMLEDSVPNATIDERSSTDLVVALPFNGKHGEANDVAAAAKLLEDNKDRLGFSHISLECDSLERVFLDLCARSEIGVSAPMRSSTDSVGSVASTGFNVPTDDADLMIGESAPNPKPLRQARALLKKRLWHFARDWRSPLATLVLPTIFVAVAMGFSLIRPPSGDEPPLDLNPRLYDTHPTWFYSIDNGSDPFLRQVSLQLHNRFGGDFAGAWQTHPNDTGICECAEGQQVCRGVSKAVEGLYQTLPGRPTVDWIVSTFQEYIEKRYGGWSLSHSGDDPLFVVWYNNKGHHALPAYLNALNEAILRASGAPGRLTTLNHPLKLSSDQLNRTTLLQHVADVGVALVLLIAFSLVAAQGAKELVRERLSEEKRILYLAGVHPVTYWTTALIWDFLIFLSSIILAAIVFEIFGLSAYVARDNLAGVCLLLVLFAWAAIPFTHLLEKAFDDSSLSNMVLFCLNTFVGVACLATILVMDILGKSQAAKDTRNVLHYGLLLFPQYALGDALVEITKNDITAELLGKFQMDTYRSPLGWDLLGLHYTLLFLVGVAFYAVNLTIECGFFPLPRGRSSYEKVPEDDDVARERIRVENGVSNDVIKTVRLRKEYTSVYGTNVAVQNLSFGVEPASCFGLLGVNGAGKSSTFRMLTTETRPTTGEILLHGRKIGRRPLCNGEIGYCPQSDAIDGFLSPHECLTIHGEICGLDDVPRTVEGMLKRFDLVKYAHQRVSSLSGGNRRKLCVAISVMSPVSVVLMDEPTSGMDPASKELVASAIRLVNRNQGCVIMSSHSVADCENLCNRVGILARAGLRCIGSVQHLKHKFGEGYVAFLRFGLVVSAKQLKESMARQLPTAIVSSRQAMAARLLIPRSSGVTLSSTFLGVRRLAEELKATDYNLTQSSLDQVLVNFSEEVEDDDVDSRCDQTGRGIPNTFPNIHDTIYMETFQ